MAPQPSDHQDKALIEKARALGIPIDDLLTADGKEIALKADKDFNVPINDVLVPFHKDEPIRDWHMIVELRKRGPCPVTSRRSELWQRITTAEASKAQPEMVMLKLNFHGIGVDLKQVARRFWSWLKRQWERSS